MTNQPIKALFIASFIALFVLAGCGQGNGNGQPESLGGPEFDLDEIGMRGMEWTGQAVLLENGLEFDDASLSLSTIGFTLRGDRLDLGQFDDPEMEVHGEPATMTLRISGVVQDHEPGRFTVELNNITPRFGSHEGAALGSNQADAVKEALEAAGIVFPEIDDDSPPVVTFEVAASDEDYTEISLTSDVDYIQRIEMRDGEAAAM